MGDISTLLQGGSALPAAMLEGLLLHASAVLRHRRVRKVDDVERIDHGRRAREW